MRQDLTDRGTSGEPRGDHTLQDRVLVYRYWPGQGSSEPDIGFGVYKILLFVVPIVVILAVFGPIVFSVLEMEQAFRLTGLVGMLGSLALIWWGRNHAGWYQVDKQGRPVRFMSQAQPDVTKGRSGISRAEFLQHRK